MGGLVLRTNKRSRIDVDHQPCVCYDPTWLSILVTSLGISLNLSFPALSLSSVPSFHSLHQPQSGISLPFRSFIKQACSNRRLFFFFMSSSRDHADSESTLLSDSARREGGRPNPASTLPESNTMEKLNPSTSETGNSLDANSNQPFGYSHSIPGPFKRFSTWGQQSRRSEEYEKRIKRHWYPYARCRRPRHR